MPNDSVKFYIEEVARREREVTRREHAIKLVERIVFGALSAGGLTILAFLINSYLKTH